MKVSHLNDYLICVRDNFSATGFDPVYYSKSVIINKLVQLKVQSVIDMYMSNVRIHLFQIL